MITEDYATALKKLIKFTKTKSYSLANFLGYDMSYISKWCTNAKLPSSRSMERVNDMMGAYFADLILERQKLDDFCDTFSIPATAITLEPAISNYLTQAYHTTSQLHTTTNHKGQPAVSIVSGTAKVEDFLSHLFQKTLHTADRPQDFTIYGEFCQLYDAGFWDFFDALKKTKPCPHVTIRCGLDLSKLRDNAAYITALYTVLNRYLNIDFAFYDFSTSSTNNLILCKDTFLVQFAILPGAGLSLCTYSDAPTVVQENYEAFTTALQNQKNLLSCEPTFYIKELGGRISFYDTNQFFFFLTNGFEYLLPHAVFESILRKVDDNTKEAVRRLCITWEEIINKAALTLLVPASSLMRYIEQGYIDLSGIDYVLSPAERQEHIHTVLDIMKKNPRITLGTLSIAPPTAAFQNTNLAFYSNYKLGFFKKNPNFMNGPGNMFYLIHDDTLHHLILQAFQQLQQLPQYQQHDAVELSKQYEAYKPLIERTLSLQAEG